MKAPSQTTLANPEPGYNYLITTPLHNDVITPQLIVAVRKDNAKNAFKIFQNDGVSRMVKIYQKDKRTREDNFHGTTLHRGKDIEIPTRERCMGKDTVSLPNIPRTVMTQNSKRRKKEINI